MANEKRLIDAINKEMPRLPDTNYKLGYSHGLNKAKDIVLKLDAVEVVRCKDCKNAVDYPAGVYPFKADSQKLVCTKTVNWRAVEPDHFCSYGERRTE